MLPIEEVTAPSSAEFHRDFVVPARPAIIHELAPWPAFEHWSFESFRERFGERRVTLPSGKKTLAAFLDEITSGASAASPEYLNQVPIHRDFPELVADLSPYPESLRPNWSLSPWIPRRWGMSDAFAELFIGGTGAGFSLLHFDQYFVNTYITQVIGDKEFTLFSPADSPRLYPRDGHPNLSRLGPLDQVDLAEFPLFAEARPFRVTVRAGQTLFVPRGTWHASKLLGPSIAVAHSTASRPNWPRFVDEFARDESALKFLIKQGVLRWAGLWSGLFERVG